MSKKTTSKKGRNGNGQSGKRRNGSSHNGKNGNGRARARSPTKKPSSTRRQKPAMIVHRPDSLVRDPRSRAARERTADERPSLAERVENMGASHVGAAAAAGAVASAVAVTAVAKGWVQPKTSAGILLTAGAATSAAGWHTERDHLMMAGAGIATAGAFSMANQLSTDAYHKIEERAAKRKAEKEAEEAEKEKARKLAEARALVEAADKASKNERRNARRIIIVGAEQEEEYATREAGSDDYQDEGQAA